MSDLWARALHDVGKYVARAARNLDEGAAATPALHAMLLADLYAKDGVRASERFRALVGSAPLPPSGEAVRALLAEADQLEAALRRDQPAARARAVAICLEVERHLRALAREAP